MTYSPKLFCFLFHFLFFGVLFHSQQLSQLLQEWHISHFLSCLKTLTSKGYGDTATGGEKEPYISYITISFAK